MGTGPVIVADADVDDDDDEEAAAAKDAEDVSECGSTCSAAAWAAIALSTGEASGELKSAVAADDEEDEEDEEGGGGDGDEVRPPAPPLPLPADCCRGDRQAAAERADRVERGEDCGGCSVCWRRFPRVVHS